MAGAVTVGLDATSGRVLLALTPLIVLTVVLVVYCLVDVLRSPEVRLLPRPLWALLVLASVPLGALAYLVWGRNHHDGRSAGFSPEELAELAAFEAR